MRSVITKSINYQLQCQLLMYVINDACTFYSGQQLYMYSNVPLLALLSTSILSEPANRNNLWPWNASDKYGATDHKSERMEDTILATFMPFAHT